MNAGARIFYHGASSTAFVSIPFKRRNKFKIVAQFNNFSCFYPNNYHEHLGFCLSICDNKSKYNDHYCSLGLYNNYSGCETICYLINQDVSYGYTNCYRNFSYVYSAVGICSSSQAGQGSCNSNTLYNNRYGANVKIINII